MKNILIAVAASALISLLVSGLMLHSQSTHYQHLAAVDVNRLLGEEVAANMKSGMGDKQLADRAKRFTDALQQALDQEAQGGDALLISPVVIRGVEDRTDEVRARVQALIQK